MPSGVSETLAAVDFTPDAATLDRALAFLRERDGGAASR